MSQFLEDCRAIEQVYVRYCEIVDTKTFDSMVEVFTPDTWHDYTSSLPGVYVSDLATLIASMHANLGPNSNCGATHHNVGNFRIQVDGDTATTKVYYYAVHRGQGDFPGALYSMWGEYDDQLIRTAGGWRIKRRIYRSMLTEGPVVTTSHVMTNA